MSIKLQNQLDKLEKRVQEQDAVIEALAKTVARCQNAIEAVAKGREPIDTDKLKIPPFPDILAEFGIEPPPEEDST